MSTFSAFDWLTRVDAHPRLSKDAKILAAAFTEKYEGLDVAVATNSVYMFRKSCIPTFPRFNAAEKELKDAGMLAGRGTVGRPYVFRRSGASNSSAA